MELALSEAELIPLPGAAPVTGSGLQKLGDLYLRMRRELERLSKRYHLQVLDAIRQEPGLTVEDCGNREHVERWLAGIRRRLQSASTEGAKFTVESFASADGREFGGKVVVNTHGLESTNIFQPDFFAASEYRHLVAPENVYQLRDAIIRRGDKEQAVGSMKQAFDWLLDQAAQGLSIQRYKGLGEMNPAQLWETTMDAASRHLSQVRIEDAVAAEDIFTTLMGDQVEPRREFIEQHALSVENLDT